MSCVPWTVICLFLCVVLRADQGSVGCWQTVYLSPWVVLRAGPRSVCCMWPGHISFWNNIRVGAEKDWLKRVSMLGSSYNVPFIWSPWGCFTWPVYRGFQSWRRLNETLKHQLKVSWSSDAIYFIYRDAAYCWVAVARKQWLKPFAWHWQRKMQEANDIMPKIAWSDSVVQNLCCCSHLAWE